MAETCGEIISRMVEEYRRLPDRPISPEDASVTWRDAYLTQLKLRKWAIGEAIKEIDKLRKEG